jgi:hypothetical protein
VQTNVQLPPPQSVPTDAANAAQASEETPVAAPTVRPRPTGARQGTATQARPAEQPPQPAVTPPAAAEPDRPRLQEVLPATELTRLKDEATARKTEARQLVEQAKRRRLNRQQTGMVERIDSFIKQAEEAEQHNDMRQASELAERALLLARELK